MPAAQCIMDMVHGPVQPDVIDREHSACLHQTGGFTMDDRPRGVIPMNPFNPLVSAWTECTSARGEGAC